MFLPSHQATPGGYSVEPEESYCRCSSRRGVAIQAARAESGGRFHQTWKFGAASVRHIELSRA